MAYFDDIERQTIINRLSPQAGGLNQMSGFSPAQVESQRQEYFANNRVKAAQDRLANIRQQEEAAKMQELVAQLLPTQETATAKAPAKAAQPTADINQLAPLLASFAPAPAQIPKEVEEDLGVKTLNAELSQIVPSDRGIAGGASSNKIVASRQANGNISITNIGTPQILASAGLSPKEQFSIDTLDASIKALKDKNSPLDLAQAQTTIMQQGNDYLTGMRKTAKDAALTSIGIVKLQEDLVQAKLKDEALRTAGFPEKATNALQAMEVLNQADKIAETQAIAQMSGNVLYTGVAAKLSLMEKGPLSNALEGEADYQQKQKMIDAEAVNAMPIHQQVNMKQLFPEDSVDPSSMVKRARVLSKDEQAALDVKDENLAVFVASNPLNKAASTLLATKMKLANKPQEVIEANINKLHSTMNDPKKFLAAYNTVYRVGKDRDENKNLLNVGTGTAEQKAQHAQLRADVILRAADLEATEAFAQSATSWIRAGVDPEWDKAVEVTRAANKPLSLENIAMEYIGMDLNGRSGRVRNINKLVTQAVGNQPISLMGNINLESMLARIHGVTPESRASEFLSELNDNKTLNQARKATFDAIDTVTAPTRLAANSILGLFDAAKNPTYNSSLKK